MSQKTTHPMTKLIDAICKKDSRLVVRLEPTLDVMPPLYYRAFEKMLDGGSPKFLFYYFKDVIDAIKDKVAAISIDINNFEIYKEFAINGGIDIYLGICKYAQKQGLLVIAYAYDLKYSDVFSEKNLPCDFSVMNSCLEKSFMDSCSENSKGVFNSNEVYKPLPSHCGTIDPITGYSNIGAIIESKYTYTIKELRSAFPNTFFLIQEDKLETTEFQHIIDGLDNQRTGVFIEYSAEILSAWKRYEYKGSNITFKEAIREQTIYTAYAIKSWYLIKILN